MAEYGEYDLYLKDEASIVTYQSFLDTLKNSLSDRPAVQNGLPDLNAFLTRTRLQGYGLLLSNSVTISPTFVRGTGA